MPGGRRLLENPCRPKDPNMAYQVKKLAEQDLGLCVCGGQKGAHYQEGLGSSL